MDNQTRILRQPYEVCEFGEDFLKERLFKFCSKVRLRNNNSEGGQLHVKMIALVLKELILI